MVEIIPAVLSASFKDLQEGLARLRGVAKHVQIDVVDGTFAKSKTWPYRDTDTFEKIVEQEYGIPFWEEFDFEFDLMITDPSVEVQKYVHAGASRIIVHAGSNNAEQAIQTLIDLREDGGAFSVAAGVALLPGSPLEALEPFEAQFDFVQVMGIKHIGRQGEPFEQKALYLLERLRRRYPELPLQVDGGVTMETARALAQAGATRLVSGSAIMKAKDPKAAYEALVQEANRAL